MAIILRTKKEIDHSLNLTKKQVNFLEFRAKKNKSFNDSELRVDFETFRIDNVEVEETNFNKKGKPITKKVIKEVFTKIDYHVKGGVNSLDKVNGLSKLLNDKGLPTHINPVKPIEYLNWMIAKATVLVISNKDSQINAEDLEIISY